MAKDNIHLSKQAYEQFKEELEYLKTVKRRELSREIGRAITQGDISENAEYDAAKNAQGLNEKRIAELEDKFARAQILDDKDIAKDEIRIGATAKLLDLDREEELKYTLVAELEANFSEGKISVTSPVGRALLGHKVGDVVDITVPAGTLQYKVLGITR